MSLQFNSEQEQISSLFTSYRNDIDIYTEDQDKDKAFYKKLFKRLLEGTGINISDVYPLGSSDEVIDACRKDTDTTRKKIYIVDGDIFVMLTPKDSIQNLFVLDSYCMENMVIDEDAVCTTLCNRIGTMEFENLKNIYKYDELINNHKDALIDLFFHKAISQKYLDYFILNKLQRYYDKNNNLDITKINEEQQELRNKLISDNYLTTEKFDEELYNLSMRFPKNSETFHRIVSGKDFLIHMISFHAKKTLDESIGYDNYAWKYNLAQHCSLERLQPLKDAIISAML